MSVLTDDLDAPLEEVVHQPQWRWQQDEQHDFLNMAETEWLSWLACQMAEGIEPAMARLMIRCKVAGTYRITSRRTYDLHETALYAYQDHLAVILPHAIQARRQAVEAVRKAVAGCMTRKRPQEALRAAQQADRFGLWSENIQAIVAEEMGWWVRQRAVQV